MAFEKVNLHVDEVVNVVKPVNKRLTVSIDNRGELRLGKDVLTKASIMALDGTGILSEGALLFYDEGTKKLKIICEFSMPKNASNSVRIRTKYRDPEKQFLQCGILSLRMFLKNYFFNMPKKAIELPCAIENQEILIIDLTALGGNTTEHKYSVCEAFLVKKDDEYIMDCDGYKLFDTYSAANKYLRKEVLKIDDIKDIDETEEEEIIDCVIDKVEEVVSDEEKELAVALKKGGIDLDKEVARMEQQIFEKVLGEE